MERQLKLNNPLSNVNAQIAALDLQNPANAFLNKIAGYCKQNNLLFSSKRLLIAEKLCNQNRFLTAEALFLALKNDRCPISISCVYMNLKTLVKANLVCSKTDKNGLTHYRAIP